MQSIIAPEKKSKINLLKLVDIYKKEHQEYLESIDDEYGINIVIDKTLYKSMKDFISPDKTCMPLEFKEHDHELTRTKVCFILRPEIEST
jgi:hypothetical protein